MNSWAHIVVTRSRWVLTIVLLVVLAAGVWGVGVFGKLSSAGYYVEGSEAMKVQQIVYDNFGSQSADIIALYTAPDGGTIDDIRSDVESTLARFDEQWPSESISTYWTAPPPMNQMLVSADRRSVAASIVLGTGSGATNANFSSVLDSLEVPGVDSQFAGNTVVSLEFTHTLERDLIKAEAVAIPVTLVLLVVIFGGVVAAAVPVFVGILAIFSSLATLRALSTVTEVSSYALNITSLIGLGLAIDYGLFIVSRYREELRSGSDPRSATVRTMLTAGRTVMFSAALLICAFAGMLVFPQAVLRSLGLGAMASVFSAAVLSLTAVPAVLAILGHRIDAWTWNREASARSEERAQRFWGGLVRKVVRRPVTISVVIIAGLLLVATPVLKAGFGEVEYTSLPSDSPARAATQKLVDDFPSTGNGATIVVQGEDGQVPSTDAVREVSREATAVAGISQTVTVGQQNDVVVLQALYEQGVDGTDRAGEITGELRAMTAPDGADVLVGGSRALVDDANAAVTDALPWMVAIMVVSTLILLFLAFGSVALPIKAVLMAGLSLAATFGVLTWVFQLGHGASWLDVTPSPMEPTFVVLILAVVFGLSTDYEVFLMSRMVEARAAGATTDQAVEFGIARTGRVVTAAALLLIVVTGAFTISGLSIMRFLGVGMIVALVIDATIVRMLLVPALVKLMGEANWWAPQWMKRVHEKVGLGH
ncbi:MAG: MMPL family transporter [Rhodococcus sp.]|uniref:MMPL family transporter n=1 Tax=Rhodococcus sp. TaxID=1831 RepID=UPI0016B964AA|nr:MMPL family transporter [Rhodococcus sp. (in: high G+C Gram-positive bacteria)]NLV80523.1 MMPL family transporter [Rhodococcus sp. (in: high G+C Gram-positive bacteria)]